MGLGNSWSNFVALFVLFAVFQKPAFAIKKSYIVYLGAHSHGREATTSADLHRVINSHTELLSSYFGSEEKARDTLIHSYQRHINGFAAFLEEEEAADIAKQPGVVSVFLNQAKKLHTTHSWEFLMLEKNDKIQPNSIWKKARFGEDIIIANLDTGVWPESRSFSGKGYGPIPSKWKGICQFNETSGPLCNRKLIGARYFNKGYAAVVGKLNSSFETPRDNDGHGSHTLSTAGGNVVKGASIFGVPMGTAKGGSPGARVASYKVCWPPVQGGGCMDADIMSGFDAAIHDGVDVISLSVGGKASDYFSDGIAISSFHAVMNGVVVVASAGNDGPLPGNVTNAAPWILTVGASTIDRQFESDVHLRNGSILSGTSLGKPLPQNGFYTLISAADAASANVSASDALLCKKKTLDSVKVKGKIVVCVRGDNSRVEKGVEAARAGAAGMILVNAKSNGNEMNADSHFLPASQINYNDGQILFAYINSTSHPQALLTPPKTVTGVKPAPVMAAFSSRGPNSITPQILKPDVTAPGVNIIAAYSEAVSPTGVPADKRTTQYYVNSGTSMSCPHVAGVVGLLRTLHPDWSPAAIKSAIMTSARTRDNSVHPMLDAFNTTEPASNFARGSGDIRPNRAMDPGLVYDMTTDDYLDFLCGIGYNQSVISMFKNSNHVCPKNYTILDMNYPSITVPSLSRSVTVTRKVKNVGKPATYACHVKQAPFFRISVEPSVLKFSKIGEEKSFKVTITSKGSKAGYQFGGLTWTDGTHYVRSPVVVANVA